ncbi:VCBS repeat-containing protein [Nannocystis sp. ncelm1]|uniref:VCBS repeat-containing protein n=1 Tax=Nannocystis radixulma TaxID=2995305 RepID=A0ABT5BP73_9BACT|nr:VCBS repeat-containing protein [Nannocystis radixulma]
MVLAACGDDGRPAGQTSATAPTSTSGATTTTTGGTAPTSTGVPTSSGGASESEGTSATDTGGVQFDVGNGDDTDTDTTGGPPNLCKVAGDQDAGSCRAKAPPDAFNPEVQWSWPGMGPDVFCGVSPLVANLTDDNGDGEIDLCDVPDVVVVAGPGDGVEPDTGHMYVLDGATGSLHFAIADDLYGYSSPALGDIDNDGIPELLAFAHGDVVKAFEHDGTLKWTSAPVNAVATRSAIAVADLDADGNPEILASDSVLSGTGEVLWSVTDGAWAYATPVAADLDDDGFLEVIWGHSAYRHDGTHYYTNDAIPVPGLPHVADLDEDGLPEVLIANGNGLSILEHDGTTKPGHLDMRLTGANPDHLYIWLRPAAVHDFDGDDLPEFSHSSAAQYAIYDTNPAAIQWQAPVLDQSGAAGGTAFDFIAAGAAQAMYADEYSLFVFDGAGAPLLEVPHTSLTYIEFPVVADVDNDGSAEIVVVSNQALDGSPPSPTVQVIRDVEDRWIQARRIWNQHTYHVTNVREDGTIPAGEPKHWQLLNTFRTQAQIEGGAVCDPPG